MNQFIKVTLATLLGLVIFSVLITFLMFAILGIFAASSQRQVDIKPSSVYELVLEGELVERSLDDPFESLFSEAVGVSAPKTIGLDDILSNIEKAKYNENIRGIYLRNGALTGGFASIKEIRDALIDFQSTGKFIVAYADAYTQSNYYLASVADKMMLNPSGLVDFRGISSELLFFKNTLEKLGIEVQVIRVGNFKSAVEPFTETKMSEANRLQTAAYTNSLWRTLLNGISESRNISVEKLNTMADATLTFQPAQQLIEYGIVDTLVYRDEVDSIIHRLVNDFQLVSHSDMVNAEEVRKVSKDKVAVIYATGGIDDGTTDGIVSEELIKTIQKVQKDDMIKSVVLRINSPGGSAYGSEQIWRALMNLKEKKPLVVSMGDVAASGGYYIACMADTIVAQPNTITGSIGIFGLIPNIEKLNQKLGLTYDGVKTNERSDLLTINRPFRPDEKYLVQANVNRGYDLFIKRCADGRGMTIEQMKAVAEGRVFTGEDALALGLVDTLGGLQDAVNIAAQKAGLTQFQVLKYPMKEDFTTRILKNFGANLESRLLQSQLGEKYRIYKQLESFEFLNGIQARLPFEIIFR